MPWYDLRLPGHLTYSYMFLQAIVLREPAARAKLF